MLPESAAPAGALAGLKWIFEGRALKQQQTGASEAEGALGEAESTATSEAEPNAEDHPESSFNSPPLKQPALLSERSTVGDEQCEIHLTRDAAAHPMMNQDVTVGFASSDRFRIQDAYTPSRARPLPDAYFGGQDDILDAIGYETEDTTYFKFTRPLRPADGIVDYCVLPEVNYLVIYAFGQSPESFSHTPSSSLEVQKASRRDFYGEDELKFHGGGIGTSHESRGSFGIVNFFDDRSQSECIPSDLRGYDCMTEAIPGAFSLHWALRDDHIRLAGEAQATGWIAVAWPSTPGQMIGSTAVISTADSNENPSVGVYALNAKSVSGVTPASTGFEVFDSSVSEMNGVTRLEFSRRFDNDFGPDGVHHLLVASHSSDALGYHGPTRAPVEIAFRASPSDDSRQEQRAADDPRSGIIPRLLGTCTASTLPGLDCSREVLPGLTLHWRKHADSVSFAIQAPGNGWAALAWPDAAGNMVPSDAVIGSADNDIGTFRLTGKQTDDIIPDSTLMTITTSQIETTNGQVLMSFTRSLIS